MRIRTLPIGITTGLFICGLLFAQGQENAVSYSNLSIPKIAGKQLFFGKNCDRCHTLGAEKEGDRSPMKSSRDPEWFDKHVKENSEIILRQERSARRQRRTAKEEAMMIEAWLFQTTPDERKQIDTMPENIFKGAYLVAQNKCLNCHAIAGYGKDVGPDLTHIARKHDHAWFIQNLIDPKQFSPDTEMPSFEDLGEEALELIADYLTSLK